MLEHSLDDFDDIGGAAVHLIQFELAMLDRTRLRAGSGQLRGDRRDRRPDLCLAEIRRRGVARAGEPWRDRLLRLPPFLREGEARERLTDEDLQDGFRLTGLFLLRHVLEPRGQGHSDARDGFINAVTRNRARQLAG